MAEFRSRKEQQVWTRLINEIEGSSVEEGGYDLLKQKIALLSASVAMLPYEAKVTEALRAAVTRISQEAQNAKTYSTSKLANDLQKLKQQIVQVGTKARIQESERKTAGGRAVAKYKGRDYDTFDFSTYTKIARQQLLELLDQDALGNPIGDLKKLMVESLKALQNKDLARYNQLQESIEELREDDRLGAVAERLSDLKEALEETDRKRKERRTEFVDSLVRGTMDRLDRLGYGPLNVGNTLRAGTAVARLSGRALMGGYHLAASGASAINSRRRINAAMAQVQGMTSMPMDLSQDSGKSEIEEVRAEQDRDRGKQFLRLFAKQVEYIKDLTKSKDEQEGSSFLSKFGAIVSSLLGSKGLLGLGKLGWAGVGAGLVSLKALVGGVIGGLGASIIKMFKVAGLAGGAVFRSMGALAIRLLPLFMKRAVIFIPVVGTLLAAIFWGKDIYDAVNKFVMPFINPLIDKMADWLKETWQWAKDKFSSVVDKVKAFVEPVQEVISNIIESVGNFLSEPWKKMKEMMSWLIDKASGVPLLGTALKGAMAVINGAAAIPDKVGEVKDSIFNWGSGALSSFKDRGASILRSGVEGAKNLGSMAAQQSGKALDLVSGVTSSTYTTLSSALGRLFTKKSDVNLDGVNPALQENFNRAVEEYRMRGGTKPIVITSAYRSYQEQAELYKRHGRGRAAPPGRSLHEFGLAIDADRAALTEMDQMGILKKYGLVRPFSSEPWHLQPKGVSLKAAQQGIYSADAAVHQGGQMPSIEPVRESVPTPYVPETISNPTPASGSSSKRAASTGGAMSQKVSAESIPQFSYADGAFFALNLGLLAR